MALLKDVSRQEPEQELVAARRQTPEEWKLHFQGAIYTETKPLDLGNKLSEGMVKRAWARLKDAQGRVFKSFDDFCQAPQPYGLECEPTLARDFLDRLLGKRRAKLVTVSASKQGARNDQHPAPEGEKSTRQDQRIRAIGERAPDVVKSLYSAGLLTAKEAEKFGRTNYDESKKVAIEAFCRDHELTTLPKLAALEGKALPELREAVGKGAREIFEASPKSNVVYSLMHGDSSDLFPLILKLHVPKGSKIADPTFGKGVFWRDVAMTDYQLLATDIETDGIDLRHLPYEDSSLDAVVLDPPFLHTPGTSTSMGLGLEESYRTLNREKHGYDAAMDLYFEGGKEASRVLRPRGVLIVKCQDQVACGKNRWSHVEIMGRYSDMGFDCIDLFVLAPTGRPATNANVKAQKHARKNHSYFLVFRHKKRVRRATSK